MILPQSAVGTYIVMILGMLCLGLWANTYKLGGKTRFELYYVDFAVGLGLAALVYGFTAGNIGFDGFSLLDDLFHSGKRQWLFAFGAGLLFTLGNMLLMGAVSVAGLAVTFPVSLGLALVIDVLTGEVARKSGSALYTALGCMLLLATILAGAFSHYLAVARRRDALAAQDAKGKKVRPPSSIKGITLAVVSGLLLSLPPMLISKAKEGELGLGPYAIMVLFGAGAFGGTCVFSLFFMNLPVDGHPLEITDYLKMKVRVHLLGILGGILWCTGFLSTLVAAAAEPQAQIGRAAILALTNCGTLIAAICGALFWKEFQQTGSSARLAGLLTLLFFGGGVVLFALAMEPGIVTP